ncbi:1-phosphofructokinase, partial [Microbacterium sp. HMWF026]
ALLFTAEGAWRGRAPKIQVASTVGAGDSSLAGYLLAAVEGAAAPERLARSIAYGAAAATLPGTQAPTPADLPAGPIAVSAFATPIATP